MTEVTVEEPKSVVEEEKRYKCDKCGFIHKESETNIQIIYDPEDDVIKRGMFMRGVDSQMDSFQESYRNKLNIPSEVKSNDYYDMDAFVVNDEPGAKMAHICNQCLGMNEYSEYMELVNDKEKIADYINLTAPKLILLHGITIGAFAAYTVINIFIDSNMPRIAGLAMFVLLLIGLHKFLGYE